MGGKSTKSESKPDPPQQKVQSLDGVKHIVLVHHSTSKEEKNQVRSFKDALVQAAPGSIKIAKAFNIAEGTLDLSDVTWLEDLNNIILIRLTPEGIDSIKDVAIRKKYLDGNNKLHGRVLSVSFGDSLPSGWPPFAGARSLTPDQKDFCLGQQNPGDTFDEIKMRSLVSAVMATN